MVIVRAPSPFGTLGGFDDYRIGGLNNEAATSLLPGVDADSASEIIEALGGHPLAIRLWSPEEGIPERAEAIQE